MTEKNDPLTATWSPKLVSRLAFKPLGELEDGPEGGMCQVYSDYWLIAHPDRGVLFFRLNSSIRGLGSIQGNRLQNFTEHHRDNSYPGALVVHSRRIFVPIDLNDYR